MNLKITFKLSLSLKIKVRNRRWRERSGSEDLKTLLSEEEWKLVNVHIGGNVAYLTSVDGDLVCKHAGCWHLDRVRPVVVAEAEGVSKVKNRVLGNL